MAKNYTATAGGMLDDLKARLGFGNQDDEEYDDYDDFEDDYDDYEDDYDDRSSSRRSGSSRSSYDRDYDRDYDRSYDRRGDSGPRLVSIDDVKESTRIPDRLNRDPLDRDSRENVTHYGTRSVIDETIPPVSSPAHNAALRDSQRATSEGYNSLFEPTRSTDSAATGSYDPYEAYSTGASGTHAPMRSLTVVKPTVYGDVERVSKAVKAGDVVVLVMHNTPDDLSKRILDFSFGVASALDANVECPGDKVFAIARGNALSEDEKRRLRNQGAL